MFYLFFPQNMQKCRTVDVPLEIISGICLAEAMGLGPTHGIEDNGPHP